MIAVPVVRLRADARLPVRAYADDAGLDLATCERVELAPGERAVVPTGIAVAIPAGFAGFVQPRSGLAASDGIAVVNSPGLIDSGYRGEIRVVLLNTDRERTFTAEPGDRIAQLVVLSVPEIEVTEAAELPASERGVRGFGSSRHEIATARERISTGRERTRSARERIPTARERIPTDPPPDPGDRPDARGRSDPRGEAR